MSPSKSSIVLVRFFITVLFLSPLLVSNAQCYKEFKYALGTNGDAEAYDIVDAGNSNFFVIGTTVEDATGKNILVTKMSAGGAILWSRTYGGAGTEVVRKASRTTDNGLLIAGSTGSFSNAKGDIMCMKINEDGTLLWLRRFGSNAINGDLGMDIIETSGGGYALAGATNSSGLNAHMAVIKLNQAANIVWSKSFDCGFKANGIGVTDNGTSLMVTADIQQSGADADGIITELNKGNGQFIKAVKLHPLTGGLSSPYISKDIANGGFWVSGHLTDRTQPSKMQQIVLRLDDELNITTTYKLVLPDYANNNFTGFQYMNNGGFIACSGMQSLSNGFIFSVREDASVVFAKKLVGGSDRKLTALRLIGNKIISVGSDRRGANNEMFIIGFDSSGVMESTCKTDTANLSVQTHSFTESPFNWTAISDVVFKNIGADFTKKATSLNAIVLCSVKCDSAPAVHANFEIPDTICVNTPVPIINKTTGATICFWNFGISGVNDSTNIYTSSDTLPLPFTYRAPGVYNIDLIADKGLSTETILTKTIIVVASPAGKILFDTSFCKGDSLLIKTDFTSDSYLWSNGAITNFIVIKEPGNYWIETDHYGCVVRDSIYVTENALPVVYLGNDTTVCSQNLLLNAGNPGATYVWQDGTTAQTFNVASSGSYKVQVKDINSCINRDSIKISMYAKMEWEHNAATTVCTGNTTQLFVRGANLKTYSWSPAITLSDSTISNPVARPFDTTLYTIHVTDNNGCRGTDSVRVNVKPAPFVITMDSTTICAGSQIALATMSTAGVSYAWSPNDYLSNISGGGAMATPEKSIKYFVTVTATNGCTDSDSISIYVNPSPAVAAGTLDTLVCPGAKVSLAAISPTAISYKWMPSLNLDDASSASPVATPAVTTDYYVKAFNQYGCTATDTVHVDVKRKAPAAIEPAFVTVCPGTAVTLKATGGDVYQWFPIDLSLEKGDTTFTVAPLITTTYKVLATDANCGITDTAYATVNISSPASINISKSNDVDCILSTATLKAEGGVNYRWSPENTLSDATTATPVAFPMQTTTYHVKVTNSGGCISTDSVTVFVFKASVENGYKLPTAFTPNNDGNNDCFGLRTWGPLMSLQFNIYNREGTLIFHTNNASDCWDGTYKGVRQPTGSYVYQIKAKVSCGVINHSGSVVLIR
ncbi:gliding motility-associated C-terminal domain-containing protein [Panacibacter ginsenosidivorans]|uniref:Gliding motility-associated C-terminal domain-containing protein n=1 Tax=Panacibacter ginsenosidivorans TaxID=1813871 RepID=A0A5B8V4V7_9BACT|nr:gliding motility-associated C-terminal domain-containing protein [Panacibacter ginsenosidivorans]QEC66065.1 gliding motility-associated C-terminal domain-containing protein [Panacibacter ginsenosidivorans]